MRRFTAVLLCALFLFSGAVIPAAAQDAYAYPAPEVLEIDLFIHPYHYLQMISTTEKKKYPALVSIDGDDMRGIGVQIRGNSSLRMGMMTSQRRLPLELCFDWADANGAFCGNPSLKLINSFTPARLMTQIIAMQAFAFLGIDAPTLRPAFIRINDVDFGLYLAVEDVNDAFAQQHFGGGSLFRPYDCAKDADPPLRAGGKDYFVKSDPEQVDLQALLDLLGQAAQIGQCTDVERLLRFFACEAFLYNTDGLTFGHGNYYLCAHDGELSFIPWDEDDVFNVFSETDSLSSFEAGGDMLFHALMQQDCNRTRYRAIVQELNDTFLNPDTFLPWLEGYICALEPYWNRDRTTLMPSEHYAADLTEGNCLFNAVYGNLSQTFLEYHSQLAAQLADDTCVFFVPDGMTTQTDLVFSPDAGDGAIILDICSRYWKLRRQFYMQEHGHAVWLCGTVFAAVFGMVLLSVFVPKRRSARGKYGRRKEE